LKKRLLEKCRLYLILDKETATDKDLVDCARSAINGGVDIVQLRWKARADDGQRVEIGKVLRKITKENGIVFIIDDDAHLAKSLNADGVHIGHEDLPVSEARSVLGADKIIGSSTHSLSQAKKSVKEGSDYISIGPIFKTPIKSNYTVVGPEIIKDIVREIDLPVFAIGGINGGNIDMVINSGATRVAVIRAILDAQDPEKAARLLKDRIGRQLSC